MASVLDPTLPKPTMPTLTSCISSYDISGISWSCSRRPRAGARYKSGRRGDSSAKRLESERMCTQGSGGFGGGLSKTPLLGSAGKGLQFDGIAKFAHLSRECRYAALHGLGIQPPRTSFDIADLVMQHFPDHLRDPMSNCPDRFVHS